MNSITPYLNKANQFIANIPNGVKALAIGSVAVGARYIYEVTAEKSDTWVSENLPIGQICATSLIAWGGIELIWNSHTSKLSNKITLYQNSERIIDEAIEKVHPTERREIVSLIHPLVTSSMSAHDISSMIYSVKNLSPHLRAGIVEKARILGSLDPAPRSLGSVPLCSILSELHSYSDIEKVSILESVNILNLHEIDYVHRMLLLPAVGNVPINDRESVFSQLAKMIHPQADIDTNVGYVHYFAPMIQQIPSDHRNTIVASAMRVIDQLEFDDEVGRLSALAVMIQAIAFVPEDNREAQIQRAQEYFNAQIQAGHDLNYIALAEMITVPLNQPLDQMQNLEAQNVHSGSRDRKTKEALQALVAHQGPISQEQIDIGINEFIDHLNNAVVSNETKSLALRALSGPREENSPWASFLEFRKNPTYGLTREESLARLWNFSKTYTDPNRSENPESERPVIKEAMIVAFSKSFDILPDGGTKRVCDEGKLQRLVVNVLQGRLAGAQIDTIPDVTPVNVAMEQFFALPGIQEIEYKDELLEAGNLYCNENVSIHRIDFLAELIRYAHLQELEETNELAGLNQLFN